MQRFSGIAAAEGIAIGEAFFVDRRRITAPKYHVAPEEVEKEIVRFKEALATTDNQLQRIKDKISGIGGEDHTLILQAHQLILQDELLVGQTIRQIEEERINAEWALRRTVRGIKQLFDQVENDYFRERRSDVDFVADHLMVTLTTGGEGQKDPPSAAVVVAYDISPAEIARYYRRGIKAFVTEVGGRNSHTSIFARSLGIPAVVGVPDVSVVIGTGDPIIVDGYRGELLILPDAETVSRYERRQLRRAQHTQGLRRERELSAETLDGWRVHLLSNIELSDEIPIALSQGAEGIGLYRTEFLYLGRRALPDEEQHLADAMQVLGYCQGRPVTFRTCDLAADKLPGLMDGGHQEMNPALGLRSIRLCLKEQAMFKAQLRGLLRAASAGQVRIMFPMISGLDEFREAKAVLEECQQELIQQGHELAPVRVGAMVEMPAAAVTADLLALEADFLSVGTNDLTQYTLAIDRVNQQVNYLFRPYHPAMLRLIHGVVTAGEAANIPVTVCGEMAADPLMTLVLMGLGVRELSMSALALPSIKQVIRRVTIQDANALAIRVLALRSAAEVEQEVLRTMSELLPSQAFADFGEEEEEEEEEEEPGAEPAEDDPSPALAAAPPDDRVA